MSVDNAEDAFRAALQADAGQQASAATVAPPPRIDPAAPHGYEDDGTTPKAPYGIGRNGLPRQKPAGPGRAGKGDKPRVQAAITAAPGAGPGAAAPAAAKDYTAELEDLLEGFWMILSGTPVPMRKVRIRMNAQAAILIDNKRALARSFNIAAQHSPELAGQIDKVTTGNAAWFLPVMFGLTPFVGQSIAMWRAPVAGDLEAYAASNAARWDAFLAAAKATAEASDPGAKQEGPADGPGL